MVRPLIMMSGSDGVHLRDAVGRTVAVADAAALARLDRGARTHGTRRTRRTRWTDWPGGTRRPNAPFLPSSPSQPARPIVAASASIAINGTRVRVLPRAPANFMVDSLKKHSHSGLNVRCLAETADSGAILWKPESSVHLGYPQFGGAHARKRATDANGSHPDAASQQKATARSCAVSRSAAADRPRVPRSRVRRRSRSRAARARVAPARGR
jgi:hypothetical protein